MPNLFTNIPNTLPSELTESLLDTHSLRIERILSLGHASPVGFWYDQPQNEWVVLLAGAARLQFEDGEVLPFAPGSYVNIPAHRRHRVAWTDPAQICVWLAIHYV